MHGRDLHRLLPPVGDGVRDGVDGHPALPVRGGDLGEDAVASVGLVEVGVGLQVDEKLWGNKRDLVALVNLGDNLISDIHAV